MLRPTIKVQITFHDTAFKMPGNLLDVWVVTKERGDFSAYYNGDKEQWCYSNTDCPVPCPVLYWSEIEIPKGVV